MGSGKKKGRDAQSDDGRHGRGDSTRLTAARRLAGAISKSLGWRLVATLMATLAILLGIGGWFALELHHRQLIELLEESAIHTGETILSSTYSSMLENDRTHLARIIENVGSRSNVVALRLVDAGGEVRYSNRPEEIGRVQTLQNPVCRGCHVGETVRSPANLRVGLALYSLPTGEGALGLAVPVLNAPECANSGCHLSPDTQRVLGVMDLELSTTGLEAGMKDARRQMAVLWVIVVLGIPAVAGALTWRVALRPLKELRDGIRRLGRGDLAHRLPTDHPGEIGELAVSFNVMSTELERTRRELEQWNVTLEDRIREKTQELERARDQMVFTEKMASLGKLAAIMAHEINNPLAGVLVYVKLLRRRLAGMKPAVTGADENAGGGPNAETLRKMDDKLALIEAETARCGDIVRNLLLFSRRRDGVREPEDLAPILERAVKLVHHQADLAQVELVTAVSDSLPPVLCNAAEIQQALLALYMNAIEAMPDGGMLRTDIHAAADDVDHVEIVISDTGPGIPDELKSKVFEPFFSTKSEGKGTGLGLAVVYGIVQRHGGRIRLESSPGKGATFRIRLPVHGAAAIGAGGGIEIATSEPPRLLQTTTEGKLP